MAADNIYAFRFQLLKFETYFSVWCHECKQRCTIEVLYLAFYSRPAHAGPPQACKRLFLQREPGRFRECERVREVWKEVDMTLLFFSVCETHSQVAKCLTAAASFLADDSENCCEPVGNRVMTVASEMLLADIYFFPSKWWVRFIHWQPIVAFW